MSCCPSIWYCTPDGPEEVLADGSGIYTPPADWTGGPWLTEAEATAYCPAAGGTAGPVTCCEPPLNTSSTMRATITGNGTADLTWDGSTYWTGSKALSCGETLHLRYSESCTLEYSCNGTNWQPAASSLGFPDCTPSSYVDSRTHTLDMDDTNAGCAAGSCGTVTVTEIAEV